MYFISVKEKHYNICHVCCMSSMGTYRGRREQGSTLNRALGSNPLLAITSSAVLGSHLTSLGRVRQESWRKAEMSSCSVVGIFFLLIHNIFFFANSENPADVRFHGFQGTKIRAARGPSGFKLMVSNKSPKGRFQISKVVAGSLSTWMWLKLVGRKVKTNVKTEKENWEEECGLELWKPNGKTKSSPVAEREGGGLREEWEAERFQLMTLGGHGVGPPVQRGESHWEEHNKNG